MREFTKSIFSYTWSSSLFGLQQAVNIFTPQGWRQTDRAVESFEKITRVTAEQMGEAARNTFKVGDDMQRRGTDIMFDVFTLGILDRGQDRSQPSGASSGSPGPAAASNMSDQAVGAFNRGLQVAVQTAGVLVQSMSGIVSSPGCGGARSQPTGWGPVPPPPSSKG